MAKETVERVTLCETTGNLSLTIAKNSLIGSDEAPEIRPIGNYGVVIALAALAQNGSCRRRPCGDGGHEADGDILLGKLFIRWGIYFTHFPERVPSGLVWVTLTITDHDLPAAIFGSLELFTRISSKPTTKPITVSVKHAYTRTPTVKDESQALMIKSGDLG